MAGRLVRDRIPEILDDAGISYNVTQLDGNRLTAALVVKLGEEAAAFMAADNPADMLDQAADMYEVFLALLADTGLDLSDVSHRADYKRNERGGFGEGLVLEWTDTNGRVAEQPATHPNG